jgi:class 3 adenylate cyclase/DNA-binding response OmpR family regulator
MAINAGAELRRDAPSLGKQAWRASAAPTKVLILQSDFKAAQTLADLLAERGNPVWQALSTEAVPALLEQHRPDWVGIDLHLPEESWLDVWQDIRQRLPKVKVFFTTQQLDLPRELRAAERGAQVFLRQPFTPAGVEQLAYALSENDGHFSAAAELQAQLPKVRIPVRVKITAPYVLLALLLSMAAAYLVSQVTLDSIEERFTNQLIETGKLSNDGMVQEEDRLLETLRLLAYSTGMAEAMTAGEAEQLRALALPIAINDRQEAIEILDRQGLSLLSLRHRREDNLEDYLTSRGDDVFAEWKFVQNVLQRHEAGGRDKFAGLGRAPWGDYFYVAGPVLDRDGQLVGVILVGQSLPTLVRNLRQDTLAHITLYDLNGQPLASTLSTQNDALNLTPARAAEVLSDQDQASLIRQLKVSSVNYSEIMGPWEVRGHEDLGLMGASLAQAFLVRTRLVTQLQIFLVVAAALLLIIGVGVYLANRITQPLLHVVRASAEVARGNLEVNVENHSHDEVAVLAYSFNHMVSRLREGSIYRDLLGRAVSPEVREQLRQTFAAGDLRLEGQMVTATVLISDIRDFTTLSEYAPPATLLAWLNEYFSEMVPLITAQGGVVNTFEGDALMAFFGVLPRPLPAQESAYRACRAAVDMLQVIEQINARRVARGEPALITGIGLNTGPVIAGGLGSADRRNYTVIGDTVNTAQRLGGFTGQFGESVAVISQHTFEALDDCRKEFRLLPGGAQTFKGKTAPLGVYRLEADRRRSVGTEENRA